MHQKSFAGPDFLPHRKVQSGVFLNRCLNLQTSHPHDFILNFMFCRHIGNRRRLAKFDMLALLGLKSFLDRLQEGSFDADLVVM
jgi:hypothetical protein